MTSCSHLAFLALARPLGPAGSRAWQRYCRGWPNRVPEIVKVAARFRSGITLVRDDLEVNGKSIMGVMMLAAECGATILIRAIGEDEAAAVDALVHVVNGKFGEA